MFYKHLQSSKHDFQFPTIPPEYKVTYYVSLIKLFKLFIQLPNYMAHYNISNLSYTVYCTPVTLLSIKVCLFY